MKRALVLAAAALVGCGGEPPPKSPEAAVKAWAAALNAGDGKKVCELSADESCKPDTGRGYEGDEVTYDGPASNGNPDDRAFSLHAGRRTLMVTAVRRGDGYLVRFDTVIER